MPRHDPQRSRAQTIPDRYIVVLKDDEVARAAVTRTADQLVQRHGGSRRAVWQRTGTAESVMAAWNG